jgi:hypothetical protein
MVVMHRFLKEVLVVCFKLSKLSYAGIEENHKAGVCKSWVAGSLVS